MAGAYVRNIRTYVHTYARTYVGADWGGGGIGGETGGEREGGGERPRRPQDPRDMDKVGWTPLMHAAQASAYCWRAARAVRSLALAVNSDGQRLSDVNAFTRNSLWPRKTCLHIACESTFGRGIDEQLYVVNSLLDAGANTEVETSEGHTPLFCAERGGFTEVCKLLLSRGARSRHFTA